MPGEYISREAAIKRLNENLRRTNTGSIAEVCYSSAIDSIRCVKDNPDLDSMLWMDNMMNIWRKCGGRKQYADGEEAHDEP